MLRKVILTSFAIVSLGWLFGIWSYYVKSVVDGWILLTTLFFAAPLWLTIAKAERLEKTTHQARVASFTFGCLLIASLFFYFFGASMVLSHIVDLITLSSFYGIWFVIGIKIAKYFS